MNFALDWDGCANQDLLLWGAFVRRAHAGGHSVFIVTMRYPSEVNADSEMVKFALDHGVRTIITTCRKAKRPYVDRTLGIPIHVWIDDHPQAVDQDADQIWGRATPEGQVVLGNGVDEELKLPGYCCEVGKAQGVAMCAECTATSAAYSAAMMEPNDLLKELKWEAVEKCDLPPAGWWCKRDKGHEGPCSAIPEPRTRAGIAHDPIQEFFRRHHQYLEEGQEYTYAELAYTRQTGWMAWITDKPQFARSQVVNPDRKVIAQGQGSTPEEACADLLGFSKCPWCGATGPDFDESPKPSEHCDHG